MTCTTIVRKMKGQKTGRYCVEVIVQGSLPFLCAVSDDTQQTLALTKRILVIQSAMLREACPYCAAAYYASQQCRVLTRNCKPRCKLPQVVLVNALYGLSQVLISLSCTMNIIIAIQTKWCKRVSWNQPSGAHHAKKAQREHCNNGTDSQHNSATLQLKPYYARSTIMIRKCLLTPTVLHVHEYVTNLPV